MKEIILASASEIRSRILSSCGIAHRVVPSEAEESRDERAPIKKVVQVNAESKAKKVAETSGPAIVIGADTLVAHGRTIIGKPHSEGEARDMLEKFAGSRVDVYTGLCVMDASTGKKASGAEKSEVYTAPIKKEELGRYFGLLGPYDKAGGFSIEGVGALLFDDIRGSYFNILGLPVMKLKELFGRIGLDILDYVRR